MKPFLIVLLTISALALVTVPPAAQTPEPPPTVFGAGGGGSNDGTVYLSDTIGQPVVGVASGSNVIAAGFWYTPDQLHIGPTSPVIIAAFEARYADRGIEIDWTVASSDVLAGFKVYRSVDTQASFSLLNGGRMLPPTAASFTDPDVQPDRTYRYRLGAVESNGEFISQIISVKTPHRAAELHQNYPNPCNPSTHIDYYLPATERVTISVYDVRGKLVTTLVDGVVGFGHRTLEWDGTDARGNPVGSGVYFYRMIAGKKSLTKKLVLVK